jgi:hypothetical protein
LLRAEKAKAPTQVYNFSQGHAFVLAAQQTEELPKG